MEGGNCTWLRLDSGSDVILTKGRPGSVVPVDPKDELMDVQDLSKWLRIPRRALYQMVSRGQIPSFHIGRRLRFVRSEIEEWLEQKRREG